MPPPPRPLIAIDARYVRERPSGIGAMVAELVASAPYRMPDADFLLLTHPKAPRPLCNAPNVRELIEPTEANGPATLWLLPDLVDLRQVSVFHAPYNILPFRLKMKTVVTIHDVMWLTHPRLCRIQGAWGDIEAAFYGVGIRHALASASALLAVSEATKRAISALDTNAGLRTKVTPHGLTGAFSPARTREDHARVDAVRRRLVPGARRYVLCVGQGTGYKNHDAIVRAFSRAFADEPTTHLVLVQRLGSDATRLLDEARHEGADGKIHVLPSVPFSDLTDLYRGALCLCHASLMEGWGMPVGEALASGCPVVTSDTSSMPEVTGGAAVHVDPESTTSIVAGLRRVAESPELRDELRRRGLVRASQLVWEDHVSKTVDVYRSLL